MLDECFADLLKGLVFDDQVMDWIVEALHQSHADEKRFREDAITRLQEEQSKIQNRLDRLYDDRLDGFIEPDFFERKSREWRQTQKRLADQITEYQEAAHDYNLGCICRSCHIQSSVEMICVGADLGRNIRSVTWPVPNSRDQDYTTPKIFF